MKPVTIEVRTDRRTRILDITALVKAAVQDAGFKHGAVMVYVPHTTAGVTINENADPDVKYDMETTLNRLVPEDPSYRHAEGNADSHLKASMMGFSTMVPVTDGQLMLGTWQGIMFCEFDGPRNRKVIVSFLAGA